MQPGLRDVATDQKVGGSSPSERASPKAACDHEVAATAASSATYAAHLRRRTARQGRRSLLAELREAADDAQRYADAHQENSGHSAQTCIRPRYASQLDGRKPCGLGIPARTACGLLTEFP